MRSFATLRRAFRWPWRSAAQVAADVDAELEFHLDQQARELAADGLTPTAARAEAERRFGDLEYTRHYCRRQDREAERRLRVATLADELRQDAHFALRQLRRNRGYTAIAVLTLALGIGATTAIFSAVDGVLLREPPFADPARTVVLLQRDEATTDAGGAVAPANFVDWRARARTLRQVAAAVPYGFDIHEEGRAPETLRAWVVTEGFLDVLGVRPTLGRVFAEEDHAPFGATDRVIISHGFWQRRFGGDPAVIGRTIPLDGRPHTVIGVLPAAVRYPDGRDLWVPQRYEEEHARQQRGGGYIHVVARLAPGATLAAAQAELDRISAELAREFPRTNAQTTAVARPIADQLVRDVRPALLALLGAVCCILLIACANVANLQLARGSQRRRELAVRGAVGASRGRLVRQLLAESALLATLGGLAGVAIARWGIDALLAMVPVALPARAPIGVDPRVLAFALGVTIATALLFGLLPALRFSRADVRGGLRGSGRGIAGDPAARRLRGALVAGEIALAVVLLVGAGLLGRSLLGVLREDVGFESRNGLALQVFLWDQVPTAEGRIEYVRQVERRLRALPGVEEAGAVSALPFLADRIDIETAVTIPGRADAEHEAPRAYATVATPGYFSAMSIALRRGRLLSDTDRAGSVEAAVVNESFARHFFPGQDPIGQRFEASMAGPRRPREIVGVVADVRQTTLEEPARPEFFVSHAQHEDGFGSMTVVVRTTGDAAAMRERVQEVLWSLAPELPIYAFATMDGLLAERTAARRFGMLLVGGLAALALVLATIGIYGVVSLAARERTHEFGVRLALGALGRDIAALTLRDGLLLSLAGVLAGGVAALALTRVLRSQLYGVSASDPATYALVAGVLVGAALLASWLPARRAARVDVVRTLHES